MNVIKAEKAVKCPLPWHSGLIPISGCAECSHLKNRVYQVLYEGLTVEYIFCGYEPPGEEAQP